MSSLVSISPVCQTPRSEKNAASLEYEEIDEEIEEQLSGGEDLLKSETSTVSFNTRLSLHVLQFDTTTTTTTTTILLLHHIAVITCTS